MRKPKKVLISAVCIPKSKRIIRKSKYSYGDALDFFARVLTNKSTGLKSIIDVTEVEIRELKLHIEKLQADLYHKESYLEKLLEELKSDRSYPDSYLEKDIDDSIRTIIKIANRFNCNPLEIDSFTGSDTLNFHAKKCDIPVIELEQRLEQEKSDEGI
ncbi:MAG: hypothetical protein CVV28_02945 [Methanobacteriales archaeon HGW-Methanobacteriales-1]|jgi:predicted Zn-dependent protease|nr:MAG: hypothetical protein CVV28_02945 [Methanobacteriales archaeon HGW-Methanobacteriales-1]